MTTQKALYNICVRLGDNNLILGQRLAEWCSRGPILEEDLALTNCSLDLFGQAEYLYEYAAALEGKGKTPDDLAFLRTEREYFNNLLVEQPNGDFAMTMTHLLLFSAFNRQLYQALSRGSDPQLAALSVRALKEVNYHFRHSSEWVIRLGNGTDESHRRAQQALDECWPFVDDLFEMNQTDEVLIHAGISVNLESLHANWLNEVKAVVTAADLQLPQIVNVVKGGCNGLHTEHLGHLLCEVQYLQRSLPGAKW